MDTTRRQLLTRGAAGAAALAGAGMMFGDKLFAGQNPDAPGQQFKVDPALKHFTKEYARLLKEHESNGRVLTQGVAQQALLLHRTLVGHFETTDFDAQLRAGLAKKSRDSIVNQPFDPTHVIHEAHAQYGIDLTEMFDGVLVQVTPARRAAAYDAIVAGHTGISNALEMQSAVLERRLNRHDLPLVANDPGGVQLRRVQDGSWITPEAFGLEPGAGDANSWGCSLLAGTLAAILVSMYWWCDPDWILWFPEFFLQGCVLCAMAAGIAFGLYWAFCQ